MRVAQFVNGKHLILEVASRSHGEQILHRLLISLAEDGEVESIACNCGGYGYRGS